MEPFSAAVGTAASVLGIIDVIARSVSSLQTLNQRFKGANLAVVNLLCQLNAVKAALSQIQAWMNETLLDYQLRIDLDDSLMSCRLLIRQLDSQISKIEWTESNGVADLSLESKVRTALQGGGAEEILTRLDRQTNALNFLLLAFNWSVKAGGRGKPPC
jgi:hypothetical protein